MSNEVLNVIKKRRSIRTYKADAIPEEILNAVLEAGTFAPTGGGKQSPIIVAITSPQYRKKIAELNAEVMGAESDPYYGAPVVVLVLADGNTNIFIEDGSCVLENMMLAAHAIGLGSCWIYAAKVLFSTEEGAAFQKELGLSETDQIVGSIAVGYPDGAAPQPKPRKESFFRIV